MANDAMTVRLYTNIRLEFDDAAGVALLTLNRPKALNALNGELLRELDEALEDVASRPGARVLILTGAGAKAFAAGADIAEMQGFTPAQAESFAALGQRVFSRFESLPVAVIAAPRPARGVVRFTIRRRAPSALITTRPSASSR